MAKYGPKAQEEVKEAMHEFKEGKAPERRKSKKKVTNPKQAIAIGLSQARKQGAKATKEERLSCRALTAIACETSAA